MNNIEIIFKREAPAFIPNDGKQTPTKDIRCLLLSMQQLHTAESVSESGIKFSREKN